MTQDKLAKNPKFNGRDILKYLGVSAAAAITPELASSGSLTASGGDRDKIRTERFGPTGERK